MAKRYTQTQQVIDTLRKQGGYATLVCRIILSIRVHGQLRHLMSLSDE